MKDQIVMSPMNGACAVAIPLFRIHHDESLGNIDDYSISLTKSQPTAYIIDCGDEGAQVVNAEFVKSKLICIGDL